MKKINNFLISAVVVASIFCLSSCGNKFDKNNLSSKVETYSENLRPQFHYSAKNSWMNDPNGLCYFDGTYHYYYQCCPGLNYNDGNLFWGHAVSKDLVYWKEEEPVLAPDKVGYIWSGTCYIDENNRSGLFTNTQKKKGIIAAYSTNKQLIGIAYSEDGYNFTKFSDTDPVIENPHVQDFRDPHLFYYEPEDKWVMIIAGGYVRVFESKDLKKWSEVSNLTLQTECPNLVRMKVEGTDNYKWVLFLAGRSFCVGEFDGTNLKIESPTISMCKGPDSYAGITFANVPNNKVIMMNWFNNWDSSGIADGDWNGHVSLPLELRLTHNNKTGYMIKQLPFDSVDKLEKKQLIKIENKTISKGDVLLDNIESRKFVLESNIDLKNSSDFDLKVRVGEGDETRIKYDVQSRRFVINRSVSNYSGLSKTFDFIVNSATIKNNILNIKLYVDTNNIEMFVNDGFYYFPLRIRPFIGSQKMSLESTKLSIKSLSIYEMKSIWNNDGDDSINCLLNGKLKVSKGTEKTILVNSFNDSKISVFVENEEICEAKIDNDKLIIKGLKIGNTKAFIYNKKHYREIDISCTNKKDSN